MMLDRRYVLHSIEQLPMAGVGGRRICCSAVTGGAVSKRRANSRNSAGAISLKIGLIVTAIVGLGAVVLGALFVVPQTGQAVVLQFGAPVRIVQAPGLYLKVPFIQQLVRYDQRVLSLDLPQAEILLNDQKRVNVNAFLRYRIADPLMFHRRVGSEGSFADRFSRLLEAAVRGVVARNSLNNLLSRRRADVMHEVVAVARASAKDYGVDLVDIRISRSELTDDIRDSVFARMRSERDRESDLLRAEGNEVANRVRAQADRQQVEIVAEATRESEILRGTGDAQRNLILGEAYGEGPEFFDFYRSLQAYRDSIGVGDTLVLAPRGEFFRYFREAAPPDQRFVAPRQLGPTPESDEAVPIL